jgi:anti-anti-sigma regulatory factor
MYNRNERRELTQRGTFTLIPTRKILRNGGGCRRGSNMLRITVHDNPESVTFQLEGRLAGASVCEAEECRQRALAGGHRPTVRFDLTGVTFIDDAGKAYLAAVYRLGAEFVAADCLTKAIVAEIIEAHLSSESYSTEPQSSEEVESCRD